MEKYSIDGRIVPTINGGAGSGNFGHLGRPGKVGGSSKGSGERAEPIPKAFATQKPKYKKYEYKTGSKYTQEGQSTTHVAEWEEVTHPIYPSEEIVKTKDQLGLVPATDSISLAKTAYDVRDKRLLSLKHLGYGDDEREDYWVSDFLKRSFKIDDKELDRLLDNTTL